jgi:hypothetical protein
MRARCSHIEWVPYLKYNGSEISIRECLQLLAERINEEG